MTTIVKIAKDAPGREKALESLREAGMRVLEADSWDAAAELLKKGDAAVVICEGEALDGNPGLPVDVARTVSHELRTPLSAMAGWLHLMDSGKLDEAGMKRAIQKLRGNIDDQVRTIDRYLGTTTTRS
jgi:signal transduction histidine kinase